MRAHTNNSKLVLVVDDDPDIRETVREILEEQGYRVVDAENGREALGRLRAGSMPDLILLDLSMPVMSGPEFCSEQQKDPKLSRIPVVVVTATGSPDQKVAKLPINGLLRKPVGLDELLGTVQRFCG
ncbi:MAG: response regulator [Polyangiaceae bacterium]|nr:response regulator [Polyangiaceae bacterium]